MRLPLRTPATLLAVTIAALLASMSVSVDLAGAAVCADYPNQAAAQQAADTIDADGDGLYCEALPCPCSSGDSGSETAPAPQPLRSSPTEERRQRIEKALWRITTVVDGDTIRVKHTRARVYRTIRLIGIDTPETHKPGVPVECGGPQATKHMQSMAFPNNRRGRRVRLATDRSQDLTDRYGRILAYAATLRGRDLNKAQVLSGLADVYVYNNKPFNRWAQYDEARRVAKKTDRGSWKRCKGDFHSAQ